MDWPTKATKNPAWRTIRGVTKSFLSYRRTILAKAESSISRKQMKHKARKPRARMRGFMGSKTLNDDAAVELDHLGPVLEPLKRGLFL